MSKILFLGDFFYDYDYISEDIKRIAEFIKENDYKTILNLEGTLVDSDFKIKKRGPNLCQNKISINVLKALNVIGVCLSNNHIMDYGEKGLKETIKLLKDNHIKYCGAGINLKDAQKFMRFEIDSKLITIYNYGWNVEETVYATENSAGCSPKEEKYILNKSLKEKNEIVIDIIHWGFEYNLYPMPIDIKLAHKMIDKGTDLIIGHHPHVIQSKECYNNKMIYYSLGNFYFGSRRKNFLRKKFRGSICDKCNYGLGIEFDIEKEKVTAEVFYYYKYDNDKTIILSQVNEEILTDISNISFFNINYIKMIRKTKLNGNPVLTGNIFCDRCKLILLFIKHSIKVGIKKILKRGKK